MSFRPHHIEIDGGALKDTVTINALAMRVSGTDDAGRFHFMVDLVEEDGGRIGLWSGFDYSAAIIEAEHARRDFSVSEPVRDVVAGGPT